MTALLMWAALLAAPGAQGETGFDPTALWDAARVALDQQRDPAAARPLLQRIVDASPDSRPAERARATLARLDALGPAAAEAWALPPLDEAAFIAEHPASDIAPIVVIRRSIDLPEPEALALLEAHRGDRRWGWLVEREIGRRLYEEGRFIDAWRVADAAGDEGRATASLRMIAWRAAPWLGALFVALGLLWIRRRRARRSDRPLTVR